jgi:hypothetical protein
MAQDEKVRKMKPAHPSRFFLLTVRNDEKRNDHTDTDYCLACDFGDCRDNCVPAK